ncbi:unnamed protein product [Oncorhynchus mykiss]|uniref:C2 domain-containing protein n=1 Tax=Oncorhynchus mykiss TaxID=8022 RepID=A0A060W1R3_ONCMY|nr:unnamed protein product [Oncorhynchus mykiss]
MKTPLMHEGNHGPRSRLRIRRVLQNAPIASTVVYDMATASSRTECSYNHGPTSQLHAVVACAKLKRKKSLFGTSIYVEVTAEGESRRTAKSHSSSNPKWDERLTLNVRPHTQVDFKVWSHHTLKADALLGKATLDLLQALEQHDRKLENVKEVLKLVLDNKGAVVATGELTVFLDGLTVNQEQLLNGNTATSTKVQQNGDAIHENGEDTPRAPSSSVNGTGCAPTYNGVDSEGPSTSSVHSDSSPGPAPVVNGDAASSPTHQTASPKPTPNLAPTDSDVANSTVFVIRSCDHVYCSVGGNRGRIPMEEPTMWITTLKPQHGRDHSPSRQVGKGVWMTEAGSTMWTTTPEPPRGRGQPWSRCVILRHGSPSAASSRGQCTSSTRDTSTR